MVPFAISMRTVVRIETEVTSKGALIIQLHGRMQLNDLQGMEDRFRALIKGHRGVIVDLSGLDVLFSMGLRALILCAQLLELKGGKLALMAPSENVMAVLRASGASQLIPICRDLEEAESVVVLSTIT